MLPVVAVASSLCGTPLLQVTPGMHLLITGPNSMVNLVLLHDISYLYDSLTDIVCFSSPLDLFLQLYNSVIFRVHVSVLMTCMHFAHM